MVFKQRFFRHRRGLFHRRDRGGAHLRKTVKFFAYPADIARDQLQGGVVVGGAALVVQRHPAGEVEAFFVVGKAGDVIGLPREAAAEVGEIDGLLARLFALQINGERRVIAQVGGDVAVGEAGVGGQPGFDAVGVLQHHTVIVGEYGRFFARFRAVRRVGMDDGDTLADVFAQERLRTQQVVIKILLQELQRRAAAGGKARRFRHDAGGDVAQGDAVRARVQRQFARFAHQREVFVVNGDGDGFAVFAFAHGLGDVGKGGMTDHQRKRGGNSGFTGHDGS